MITTDKTITVLRQHDVPEPSETVQSTANPVIHVKGSGLDLSRLSIIGHGKPERQIGIFSDNAQQCRISQCNFHDISTAIKLDKQADHWNIEHIFLTNIIGKIKGLGYGILIGSSFNHINFVQMIGSAEHGRHVLYITDDAHGNIVSNIFGNGLNHATVCINANEGHTVNHNQLLNITALNQRSGGTDSAGLEIDGDVRSTIIRNYIANNVGRHGLIVNTFGYTNESDIIIDGFIINQCQEHGLSLHGVNGAIIRNGLITRCSMSQEQKYSCINLQAEYQRVQQATQNIHLDAITLSLGQARTWINENTTIPRPHHIFETNIERSK